MTGLAAKSVHRTALATNATQCTELAVNPVHLTAVAASSDLAPKPVHCTVLVAVHCTELIAKPLLRLDKTCTRYKMEISAEKTKLMTNSANGIQREIKVKRQVLGTVTSSKYIGAVVSDDGSKPEALSRIVQATAALTKLKPNWRGNNISLGSKVKLMRSLVISIFLFACESWTFTAELEKRTQAFEMRCYWRLLNISYKDHVTNEEVRRKIQAAIGEYDELLTLVKKRKLSWFGHVSMHSGLAKTILQGTMKGKRKRVRQKKRWEDNIKEWTGMDFASSTRAAENRTKWKGIVVNSSVVPRRSSKVMG